MAAQPSANKDRAAGASAAPRVGWRAALRRRGRALRGGDEAPQVGRQNETPPPKHPAPPMRRDVARPTATPPITPRKPRCPGSHGDASRPAIESPPTAGTPPPQATSNAAQRSNSAAAQHRNARTRPPRNAATLELGRRPTSQRSETPLQAHQHPASRTAAAIPLHPTRRPQRRRCKTGRVRRNDAARAPPERKTPALEAAGASQADYREGESR